jgi:hypothetical protein
MFFLFMKIFALSDNFVVYFSNSCVLYVFINIYIVFVLKIPKKTLKNSLKNG